MSRAGSQSRSPRVVASNMPLRTQLVHEDDGRAEHDGRDRHARRRRKMRLGIDRPTPSSRAKTPRQDAARGNDHDEHGESARAKSRHEVVGPAQRRPTARATPAATDIAVARAGRLGSRARHEVRADRETVWRSLRRFKRAATSVWPPPHDPARGGESNRAETGPCARSCQGWRPLPDGPSGACTPSRMIRLRTTAARRLRDAALPPSRSGPMDVLYEIMPHNSAQRSAPIPTPTSTGCANGMKVVIREDHFAPVVAEQVWVAGRRRRRDRDRGRHRPRARAHAVQGHRAPRRRRDRRRGRVLRRQHQRVDVVGPDRLPPRARVAFRRRGHRHPGGCDAAIRRSIRHELDKELGVVLEEWKRGQDSPSNRVFDMMFETAYCVHPYKPPGDRHRAVDQGPHARADH